MPVFGPCALSVAVSTVDRRHESPFLGRLLTLLASVSSGGTLKAAQDPAAGNTFSRYAAKIARSHCAEKAKMAGETEKNVNGLDSSAK